MQHNFSQTKSQKTLILGTRGSLLATTQARQVADEIENLCLCKVELKIIKTQGDQIADVPLWQLDGKDFFTKELDHALLAGEVDFVVHSLKDLGGERPEKLCLAAITRRVFPNDILLIQKETLSLLEQKKISGSDFIVGTSSPRRIANLEKTLIDFLPMPNLKVQSKFLRGNVNSRVKKLLDGDYHGIVLAMTGLERLSRSPKAMEEMLPHFEKLSFMLLPQMEFPTAAGQGALGIECLADNAPVKAMLEKLHDPKTAREVLREREIFRQYGGGCHLAVGIFARELDGQIHSIEKGVYENKNILRENYSQQPPVKKDGLVFLGLPKIEKENLSLVCDEFFKKVPVAIREDLAPFGNLLIASAYGVDGLASKLRDAPNSLRWCSGNRTMKKLAAQGIWCHGSLEGLGEHQLEQLLSDSHFLKNFSTNAKVALLTHKEGKGSYTIIESYERTATQPTSEFIAKLNSCGVFYWTSFDQYQFYLPYLSAPAQAVHCCGMGKTYQQFQAAQINVTPFPSMNLFKSYAGLI